MSARTQIWSCGGGVQSTAIAALIVSGKLEKPDLAIIVDTERELSTTWDYMDGVTAPALASVGVVINRVKKSAYSTVDLWGGSSRNTLLIPAFTSSSGSLGKLSTFCSNEWKTRVIQRWASKEHGVKSATAWLGISTDEQRRVKTFGGKWAARYPLIELNRSREDCFYLVQEMGWPIPPRSSCWMCPNHHEAEWIWQKEHAPRDHEKAITFDLKIREKDAHAWLHPSATPLGEVEFDPKNEAQFGKHCQSGLCFV